MRNDFTYSTFDRFKPRKISYLPCKYVFIFISIFISVHTSALNLHLLTENNIIWCWFFFCFQNGWAKLWLGFVTMGCKFYNLYFPTIPYRNIQVSMLPIISQWTLSLQVQRSLHTALYLYICLCSNLDGNTASHINNLISPSSNSAT